MRQRSSFFQFATFLTTGTILALQAACATSQGVITDYQDALYDTGRTDINGKPRKPADQTAVVIMIDGLGAAALREGVLQARVSNIQSFFSGPAGNLRGAIVPRSRASFPTLTYPNLVSLLTGLSVADHGIIGNRMYNDGNEIVNFENVLQWKELSKQLKAPTAFALVDGQGMSSVSYTYPFFQAGTASQKPTLEAAAGYASKDYLAVDDFTLNSLAELLEGTPLEKWPRFIFVHLISVDGVEHEKGPSSPEVFEALARIDRGLARTFRALERGERAGHRIATALTADHGFTGIEVKVPIDEIVSKVPSASGARLVSDNRIAALFAPVQWQSKFKRELSQELAGVPGIAWTALRSRSQNNSFTIEVFHADGRRSLIEAHKANCAESAWQARLASVKNSSFHCLEEFDAGIDDEHPTYFISALTEYFSSARAPDLILVPSANADFTGEYKGNHGGLMESEILVPALVRGVKVGDEVFPTHRLLNKMGVMPRVR